MYKKYKCSIGEGKNKVEFDLNRDQVQKVIRLQSHIKRQREEIELAKRESREPDLKSIKY